MNEDDDQSRVFMLLAKRERQCRVEYEGYDSWLTILRPLRWFTIIGGTLLSALAGATIFSKPSFLGEQWPIYAGVFSLIASILSGLHAGLKCDSHQSECQRLIQLYQTLETSYQAVRVLSTSEISQRWRELEARFDDAKTKATAVPPRWIRKRAERNVGPLV